MRIRCKMLCLERTEHPAGQGASVKLAPVFSADEDSENKRYWDATPSGVLELQYCKVPLDEMPSPGSEYYVDIRPAEPEQAA